RRLCRRLQPRAADGALGAVFLRPVGARLHQAHLDPEMRPGSAACAGSGRDDARKGGGAGCPFALDWIAPQSVMTKPPEQDDSTNRIVGVTLDEDSIGR